MSLVLKLRGGKHDGEEIRIKRVEKFFVGRGKDCHLRPTHTDVSRHHCVLILSDDMVTIRDLGSSNGTFVNGKRITAEVELNNGDLVTIGPLAFQTYRKVKQAVPADAVVGELEKPPRDDDSSATLPAPPAKAEPKFEDETVVGTLEKPGHADDTATSATRKKPLARIEDDTSFVVQDSSVIVKKPAGVLDSEWDSLLAQADTEVISLQDDPLPKSGGGYRPRLSGDPKNAQDEAFLALVRLRQVHQEKEKQKKKK